MMPTDPIRIMPGEDGHLIVQLPYSPDHVAKIKTVTGRRWHAKERHWTVPRSDGALGTLLNLFPGKPVDVDPALGAVSSCPTLWIVSILTRQRTGAGNGSFRRKLGGKT